MKKRRSFLSAVELMNTNEYGPNVHIYLCVTVERIYFGVIDLFLLKSPGSYNSM